MMRMWTVVPIMLIAYSVDAPGAAAQDRKFDLKLVPTIGWYKPTQDIRRVPEPGSTDVTRMAAGPMAGLAAELSLPFPAASLRGSLAYVDSDLAARRSGEFESCGSNCSRATYRLDPIAETRIFLAVADLVGRGPRIGPVHPYLVGGGGIKRYDIAQGELTDGYVADYAEDVTQRTYHVGIGTDLRLGNQSFVVEVGDYIGAFRTASGSSSTNFAENGGNRQHDISLTAGWRIRLP